MKFREAERVSRRQAAERLIDLAYALTAGGPLELSADGRRVKVPVASELCLKRELRSTGDQVEFELGLTWSAPMHCGDDLASAAHRSGSD